MRKSLLAGCVCFLIGLLIVQNELHFRLFSLFDGVDPVVQPSRGDFSAELLEILLRDSYAEQCGSDEKALWYRPIIYEDQTCFYILNPETLPWAKTCSYYARISGGCVRKCDGKLYDPALGIWSYIGYVNCKKDDICCRLKDATKANEIDVRIGRGYRREYWNVFSGLRFVGVAQRRTYLCCDGDVCLFLLNGELVTGENFDIQWCNEVGVFDVVQARNVFVNGKIITPKALADKSDFDRINREILSTRVTNTTDIITFIRMGNWYEVSRGDIDHRL